MTALDVSERHIAVQYHVEPHIDVFDRKSKKRQFRLEGKRIIQGGPEFSSLGFDDIKPKAAFQYTILIPKRNFSIGVNTT